VTAVHHSADIETRVSLREWLLAVVVGISLTGFVWQDVLSGGGLVGGDTYTYFFPQKQLVAEAFARGTIPLWHDRTALGYPLHAESQAAVFYPTTQVLYRLLDFGTAYHVSILLHYVLAFVFAWRFMRCQQVSCLAALFSATAFVYGWFPARISLEWSIIGGVWFPLCLWLTDRLVRCPSAGRWAVLAACFALHLLAGHFALAFITQLTCFCYAILCSCQRSEPDRTNRTRAVVGRAGLVAGSIGFAALLAAVQLVPTYELKQISQRSGGETVFDPAYGHLPPVYLTQLVASWWYWHSPEIVASGQMTSLLPWSHVAAGTNPVEGHFYLGLIAFVLVCSACANGIRNRISGDVLLRWLVLGALSVVYATGWLVPVFRHLPGFGWFMGPGRYTIVAQLAGAIIAGLVLDAIWRRRGTALKAIIALAAIAITIVDVEKSSQPPIRNAVVVADPPLNGLAESWVAERLSQSPADVRLLIRGPNVGNLYGVSCLPSYLGLGPAAYVDEQALYSAFPQPAEEAFPSADQQDFLQRRGVTHLLTTEEVPQPAANLKLLSAGPDSFLNRVWGRGASPCWLYQFESAPSRVVCDDETSMVAWRWLERTPSNVRFEVTMAHSDIVWLRELMMPGWRVTVDERPQVAELSDRLDRGVRVEKGTHTIQWVYAPGSFSLGVAISGFGWLLLLTGSVVWFRKRDPSTRRPIPGR
jgi:hypothetical protein